MIAVGVDTHKHQHVAVAVSELGQLLGEIAVAATAAGYQELVAWLAGLGGEAVVGIEGAGSYGAGLCRHLEAVGISVVEVERPRRRDRRQGKSDRLDALLAAKRVLARDGVSTPRAGGNRAALSVLLVAYRSCVEERTRLLNQLQGLHVTAPASLRERIGHGNGARLADRLVRMRDRPGASVQELTMLIVLRDLARRARQLEEHAGRYRDEITRLVRELNPALLDEPGVGPISAAKLLVCDPARFKSEAAFARCNGTAPQPASSGQTIRHRLSRSGDRQANNAIHTIAMSRSINHAESRAYLQRRISQGKTHREAMRSLKRHVSRRLYRGLTGTPLTP
jgi:transposase